MNKQIFLSHSGVENDLAQDLAEGLERAFGELKVFCTSRPQHRFDPNGLGEYTLPIRWPKYQEEDIQRYLRENLKKSQLHLFLATGNSLLKGNNWVSYEMQIAAKEKLAPVLVLVIKTFIRIRGNDDPKKAEGLFKDADGMIMREIAERARWLAPQADMFYLDSYTWEHLLEDVIPCYLSLKPMYRILWQDVLQRHKVL